MSETLILTGGRIVDATGERGGWIAVRDGMIANSGDGEPPEGERIDVKGALIAPGIVDLGVFAVDPAAALAGGITTVALMPDQSPPIDEPAMVQRSAASGDGALDVVPVAAATKGLAGRELAEMGLMKAAGARAVATGRGWIGDSGVMARALAYAAALDLTMIAHAEDGGLTRGAVATEGETATRLGLSAAPAVAEALAVARDLALAEAAGARLHFRQLTTAASFDLVRAAKARGVPVTCGITPAHLLLSDIAVTSFRTFAHLSPPLRSEADRQAALRALADGTVDVLCSGHDPRGPEDKRLPFADSRPGMAGAATLLALGLGLVGDGSIDRSRLFALLARNPAQVSGSEAGSFGEGVPADLILIDPDSPWVIDADATPGLSGNSPFDGLPVQGRVLRVMKNGRWLR